MFGPGTLFFVVVMWLGAAFVLAGLWALYRSRTKVKDEYEDQGYDSEGLFL